jgi:GTP-binding protein Era
MQIDSEFRSGYVTLIGSPNVGKSTLLNQLLKFKLSIVSKKPQTTRRQIVGILSDSKSQIIFLDTPGILQPQYQLQNRMMSYVKSAIGDSDIVVIIEEVTSKILFDKTIETLIFSIKVPVIFTLNKIDLIEKEALLPIISEISKINTFSAIIPISALKNEGVDQVLKEIKNLLPLGPPFYPLDEISNQNERFFVEEIIREKIFDLYGQEIPYSTHVYIEEFRSTERGKNYIRAVVMVERNSQKAILIGRGGNKLKKLGQFARQDIEKFINKPVYLELYVKKFEGWRRDGSKLKELGY